MSAATVLLWVTRAEGRRVDRVDFADRSSVPFHTQRTNGDVEELVVAIRGELKRESDLGMYGARAIREVVVQRHPADAPSVRTINRILLRRGAFDRNARVRRPPPPPGWYLPSVARKEAEIDSFDIVEGLIIRGGLRVEVLNAISLHGGLAQSWVTSLVTAKSTWDAALEHWRVVGAPTFAQFDNDTIFQGAHHHRDSFGRVTRLCLALGITPVFAPPREPGFQASIEAFNGLWQRKVWRRFEHPSLASLQKQSSQFIAALRSHRLLRIEGAPARRALPSKGQPDLHVALRGCVIYIRRTSEDGAVKFLGRRFPVDRHWPQRLVRCEVLLSDGFIRCYALRRRDPSFQPLLAEISYEPPSRPFIDRP